MEGMRTTWGPAGAGPSVGPSGKGGGRVGEVGCGGRGSGGGGGLEAESPPGIVEAIWVGEADVAAGSAVQGMANLHPQDLLGDASLSGDGQTAHAA